MRRERIIASLLGLLLLTGCTYRWQVYPGERRPKEETAIIKGTKTAYVLRIDGQRTPRTSMAWRTIWGLHVARVLPGPHVVEVAVGPPSSKRVGPFYIDVEYNGRLESVTIDATAGGTYRVHFDNDNDAVWVEDSRSP